MYAPSTIAMTLYNLLTMSIGGRQLDDLRVLAVNMQHPGMDEITFEKAVEEMISRGYVTLEAGTMDLVDPGRRRVLQRSRQGNGWNGWLVGVDRSSLVPIAEALS